MPSLTFPPPSLRICRAMPKWGNRTFSFSLRDRTSMRGSPFHLLAAAHMGAADLVTKPHNTRAESRLVQPFGRQFPDSRSPARFVAHGEIHSTSAVKYGFI